MNKETVDESSKPRLPWRRSPRFWHWPINKGAQESKPKMRLPQINSPAIVGALSVVATAGQAVMKNLQPHLPAARDQQIRQNLLDILETATKAGALENLELLDVRVSLREAFGKPTLISADLVVAALPPAPHSAPNSASRSAPNPASSPESNSALPPAPTQTQTAWTSTGQTSAAPETPSEFFLRDLFARLVERLWDNPVVAPVAIRGRVVEEMREPGSTGQPGKDERVNQADTPATRTLLDMRDLGYQDEIGRPEDLYANYGAPAVDPRWRP